MRWSIRREAEALVEAAAAALEERGESVFVEHAGLEDVDRLLALGVEPGETWLGRLFAHRGLKVRDMYHPEGFMEDGPKLVGGCSRIGAHSPPLLCPARCRGASS